jgi:hypothetical protein
MAEDEKDISPAISIRRPLSPSAAEGSDVMHETELVAQATAIIDVNRYPLATFDGEG